MPKPEPRRAATRRYEETERAERIHRDGRRRRATTPWTLRLDRRAAAGTDDAETRVHRRTGRGPRLAPDEPHLVQRRAREGERRKARARYDERSLHEGRHERPLPRL